MKAQHKNTNTIEQVNLVDIRDVKIDRQLSREERMKSFLTQIKNPYNFKCGEVTVKVKFS